MASTQFIPSQKLISNLLGLEDLDGLERLSRAISALDAITPERTRDREMAAVAGRLSTACSAANRRQQGPEQRIGDATL
jgi:hypothetical protein